MVFLKNNLPFSVRNASYFSEDINDLLKIFFIFPAASGHLVSRFLLEVFLRSLVTCGCLLVIRYRGEWRGNDGLAGK